MKWSFLKHRKTLSSESFKRRNKIMIIKIRTQQGSTLSLTNSSGSLLSSYAFISQKFNLSDYYKDEPNPEYEP